MIRACRSQWSVRSKAPGLTARGAVRHRGMFWLNRGELRLSPNLSYPSSRTSAGEGMRGSEATTLIQRLRTNSSFGAPGEISA
jgi:hypothetical protein